MASGTGGQIALTRSDSLYLSVQSVDNWQNFVRENDGNNGYIDLVAANRWLLETNGISGDRISSYDLCTHTLSSLFFSHRRDGLPVGRMFAFGCMNS